jgi:hypothetical protein
MTGRRWYARRATLKRDALECATLADGTFGGGCLEYVMVRIRITYETL